MAAADLANLGLSDLRKLQHDVENEIKNRQRQDVGKAREQIIAIARELGVPIEQLIAGVAPKSKISGQSAQKYQNPDNPAQTWSGRGRKPKWLTEAISNGKTIESFQINLHKQ